MGDGVAASAAGAFALEALGVEKQFGATPVRRGANLRVRPGEIHALMGGNGAGRSTLIRIVSGDVAADAGTLRVAHLKGATRGSIAVVHQELALFPHLPVAENIRLPAERGALRLFRSGRADEAAHLQHLGGAGRGLVGEVCIATADGSPTTVKLLEDGVIQGLFLQEAGGQGIEAVAQVHDALAGQPTTRDLPLAEPLVTAEDVDSPESSAKLKRVYPPSAGAY